MKVGSRITCVIICCVCIILISIASAVAFYVVIANWGGFFSIIGGVCLFFAYFFLGNVMKKYRKQTQCLQRRSTDDYMDDAWCNYRILIYTIYCSKSFCRSVRYLYFLNRQQLNPSASAARSVTTIQEIVGVLNWVSCYYLSLPHLPASILLAAVGRTSTAICASSVCHIGSLIFYLTRIPFI